VVALGVPHISVYPLEVHEGTHFGGITAGGIGTMLTCYSWWRNSLRSTVMNTTRFQTMPTGAQCLHNKIYWHDEEYYALGPSAAGT